MLLLGVLLESAAAAAMGAVPVRRGAGGAYLLLRCLQGAGSALSYTALLAFCAERFAKQLATVIGIQEAIAGVGFMVGPVIGGALFTLGGFPAPFVAMGIGLLAALPLLPFALPRRDAAAARAGAPVPGGSEGSAATADATPHALTFREVLRVPAVLDAAAVTLLAGVAFGFVGPTLAPQLSSTLHASEAAIGALFGVCAAAYAAAAPAAGALADSFGAKAVMRAGVAQLALAYVLLGPSPALGAAPRAGSAAAWAAECAALLLLGAGAAAAIIPCLPLMEREAAAAAAEAGSGGSGAEAAAALFNAVYCAGEAAGPLVGAALVGGMGFRWATTAVAALLALYLAAVVSASPARRRAARAAVSHAASRLRDAAAWRGRADATALLLFEEDEFGDEPQAISL